MSQAEYEEDRDDQFEDEDNEIDLDSLALSKSMPEGVGLSQPTDQQPSTSKG